MPLTLIFEKENPSPQTHAAAAAAPLLYPHHHSPTSKPDTDTSETLILPTPSRRNSTPSALFSDPAAVRPTFSPFLKSVAAVKGEMDAEEKRTNEEGAELRSGEEVSHVAASVQPVATEPCAVVLTTPPSSLPQSQSPSLWQREGESARQGSPVEAGLLPLFPPLCHGEERESRRTSITANPPKLAHEKRGRDAALRRRWRAWELLLRTCHRRSWVVAVMGTVKGGRSRAAVLAARASMAVRSCHCPTSCNRGCLLSCRAAGEAVVAARTITGTSAILRFCNIGSSYGYCGSRLKLPPSWFRDRRCSELEPEFTCGVEAVSTIEKDTQNRDFDC
ncbi:uncharacterized protein DS421_16g541080 [Arachis hypogaea]|nr:uncharacterized protein DS421_16g541080 [Arachis hypogaea]